MVLPCDPWEKGFEVSSVEPAGPFVGGCCTGVRRAGALGQWEWGSRALEMGRSADLGMGPRKHPQGSSKQRRRGRCETGQGHTGRTVLPGGGHWSLASVCCVGRGDEDLDSWVWHKVPLLWNGGLKRQWAWGQRLRKLGLRCGSNEAGRGRGSGAQGGPAAQTPGVCPVSGTLSLQLLCVSQRPRWVGCEILLLDHLAVGPVLARVCLMPFLHLRF